MISFVQSKLIDNKNSKEKKLYMLYISIKLIMIGQKISISSKFINHTKIYRGNIIILLVILS